MAHAGTILLKIIAHRLSVYSESLGILPWEQSSFRSNRSTMVMMFMIRQLQGLLWPNTSVGSSCSPFLPPINFTITFEHVCDCSGWFPVEKGFRQGCVLVLLSCFNTFSVEVISVACARFKVEKYEMDALLGP